MDFLLENDGKPIPDSSATMGIDSGSKDTGKEGGDDDDDDIKLALQMSQGDGMEAKSIKCSECGKIFRNTAMAEFQYGLFSFLMGSLTHCGMAALRNQGMTNSKKALKR